MDVVAADPLDLTFAALADPTRRAILARLATGDASVTELAEPFAMSQPAISKHLKVLERAGLISRGRDAQRRPRRLDAAPLAEATMWLERYRQFWEARYRQLDALLDELTKDELKKSRITRAGKAAQEEVTMMNASMLTITTPSDREIAMTRVFAAPARLVYDAHTKPELLKRWLGVFGGWSLSTCEIDLRVGGKYRWVWSKASGTEMGMDGTYQELVTNARIVATEAFDDPWYEGQCLVTTEFVETDGTTTLTATMLYDSKKIRDAVLKSPMETGIVASYDKLAALLAESTGT